ncbi:B12-binding domain-containing radical SAM protein [uncultured Methanoregula sp.]|uniref:B12-binding domain-containing radical SAM protein n=1 Tax=uncultured Methanoregula sp. TaxID=1005933 RepID=UPI002AAB26FD|nr:radical SAM protein [uncultured Methanoregula sp.]
MRIALLFPLWTEEYGNISHFAKKAGHFPPLNLAFLAAYAERKGHTVIIIDGEVEGLSINAMVERVQNFNPDLIGITATTPFYHIAVELGNALKKVINAPICIGGPHITILKEKSFEKSFDYAFINEADNSWNEFLDKFEKNGNIEDVKGLLLRKENEVIFTGAPTPCKDVNKIVIPARHLLKNELYNLGTIKGLKKFTTIMTVRGCPFNCIFCSTKVFGKDIRRRSPELVIREIKECIDKFGIEHFMFLDDTLTLHRQHIMDICDLIIKENLNITFEGSTRANLVDEELIKKMTDAGLIRLSFGLESVDETIRETMKKMVPLESYIVANKLTNKFGIETLNSCMIGLPGESYETVKKTLAFLRRSKEIKQANISIAVPYPGTELFEMAKNGENGLKLETEDFSKYRRYNAAVMTVGELSPEKLLDIQNEAFASIYLAPWRWEPMIRKSGAMGALLTFNRLVNCLKKGDTRYLTNNQLGIEED